AIELADAAAGLRSYLDEMDGEPGRLEEIEERLAALDRLQRKHGGSIESVLAHAELCRSEIARLCGAAELADELAAHLAERTAEREGLAAELTKVRAKAARELVPRAAGELAELAM